eukprot:1150689-Pelagomonas_calceolata.AAC.2
MTGSKRAEAARTRWHDALGISTFLSHAGAQIRAGNEQRALNSIEEALLQGPGWRYSPWLAPKSSTTITACLLLCPGHNKYSNVPLFKCVESQMLKVSFQGFRGPFGPLLAEKGAFSNIHQIASTCGLL